MYATAADMGINTGDSVTGILRVRAHVSVTDIFGHNVSKAVSLGAVHCIGVDAAKEMAANTRNRNPDLYVSATLTVEL